MHSFIIEAERLENAAICFEVRINIAVKYNKL